MKDKTFQHQVDSADVILMHREVNNIQGLNRESDTFKDETRNIIGELKEANEKDTPCVYKG